jgi:hypothetical protein
MAALGLGLLSAAMLGFALILGIHCPECDRYKLGSSYGFWVHYFDVQRLAAVVGVPPALLALLGADRRRYALGAVVLTLFLSVFTFR